MKNRIREILSKTFQIPGEKFVSETVKSFSLAEKVIFAFFAAILVISSLGLVYKLNNSFLVEIPSSGGELTEGIIGYPRFVNPLLAISDADKDLSSIVYSGLMKIDQNGELVPDLAQNYTISEDGRTYTFILRDDLEFHDGSKITSADVLFTVESVQNEMLKSPKRPNWIGVTADAPNERTVVFTLKQPYAPFLESTNLGILPKKIWQDLDAEQFPFSQFNVEPIGSGPYKISKVIRNDSGVVNFYSLKPFGGYALGKPHISRVNFHFFSNEQDLIKAYEDGEVDNINSITPQKAKEYKQSGRRVEKIPLTRVFGLFLNQNQAPIFTNKEVRKALDKSLDRSRIINEVLFGYATAIDGPIPTGVLAETNSVTEPNIDEAKKLLEDNKWTYNDDLALWQKKTAKGTQNLSFSIATADAPELKKTAEIMKESWAKIGVPVDIKVFESGTLNQTVIRPRKYDSLFFGEIIGRDIDLFAFWHSSQRNDPGLNVSLYTSIKSDKLLEEMRTASDQTERERKFLEFRDEIKNDLPAIFSYSPDFLYILPPRLKGFHMSSITVPSERFSGITSWYIDTDKVWTFLANKK